MKHKYKKLIINLIAYLSSLAVIVFLWYTTRVWGPIYPFIFLILIPFLKYVWCSSFGILSINNLLYDLVEKFFIGLAISLSILFTSFIRVKFGLGNILEIVTLIIIVFINSWILGFKIVDFIINLLNKYSERIYKMGVGYYNEAKYGLALRYLNKAQIFDPDNFKTYYYKGTIYLEKEKVKKAIKELKTCLLVENSSAYCYVALGEAYDEIEEIETALDYYLKGYDWFNTLDEKFDEIDKTQEEGYLVALWEISRLFCIQKKYQKSIEYTKEFKKTVSKSDERYIDSLFYLAELHFRVKEFKKGKKYLLRGLKERSDLCLVYHWSDEINTDIKKKAENFFEKKCENRNNQKLLGIYNSLLYFKFQLNDKKEFKDYFSELKNKFPKTKTTYYWKIMWELKQENYKEAREIYKEIDYDDSEFIDLYNWEGVNLKKNKIKEILEGNLN
ncbi:hypothetical protein Halha_1532 [Halobacteroides halobius DSM 5150]|uniref:Uncharacterized protein n=1 Tax=Halobacteroides halobius (strain ATCC 35273 / DSM 5150 / MD-1) TaxID=748449 RepID=L0KBK9_HALHC|nr:hypothetical protein [Halobacteroides halobius]AGB41473.1 hypothetical protein Halha_1532 [Halobacteroides halobius DSM 5150]